MTLSELLKNIEVINEYEDKEVAGVVSHTEADLSGALFVCIAGRKTDGHDYAEAALKSGAAAVVCERDLGLRNQIMVKDSREAYSLICKNQFGRCCEDMDLIGATGTNGKTTVSTLVSRLLTACGIPCGLISTIGAEYDGVKEELSNTTPDARVLHRLFRNMTKHNVKTVAMEASSHALDQKRLAGVHFAVAIFTNLTQDHLDYHESMVQYYKAKKKLFSMSDFAVINIDDSFGKQLSSEILIPYASFSSKDDGADYFADNIICESDGVQFTLRHEDEETRIHFAIPGIYSVENAMAAMIACNRMGIPLERIKEELEKISGIKGRSEIIPTGRGFTVICDYAHTPDGIMNILKSVKAYAKGKVTILFGCGGDRDKEKRPIMGKIAAELADFSIITSDNPRTEPPNRIIADILRGVPDGAKYIAIGDRKTAIRYALATAKPNDTVILAGKGHEEYQVLGDKRVYFDERKLVKGIIKTL